MSQLSLNQITRPALVAPTLLDNLIINGDFSVDQRVSEGNPVNVTSPNSYGPDRFHGSLSGADQAIVTIERRTDTPPPGFENYVRMAVTTPETTIAADELTFLRHTIEGYNIDSIGFGTSWAKPLGLGFWVRTNEPGIYPTTIASQTANRYFIREIQIHQNNVWEYKIVPFPPSNSGIWMVNNGIGFMVFWDLGSGSDAQAAPDNWGTDWKWTTTNRFPWIETSGATFDIGGVQLITGELFDVLSEGGAPFLFQQFAKELWNCKRYFQVSWPYGETSRTNANGRIIKYSDTHASADANVRVDVNFDPEMRGNIAFNPYDGLGSFDKISVSGINNRSPIIGQIGTTGVRVSGTPGVGRTERSLEFHWQCSSEI